MTSKLGRFSESTKLTYERKRASLLELPYYVLVKNYFSIRNTVHHYSNSYPVVTLFRITCRFGSWFSLAKPCCLVGGSDANRASIV